MAKRTKPNPSPNPSQEPAEDKPDGNEVTALPNDRSGVVVDDRGLAFAVYVLYLAGYFVGVTALIGVAIAYFQERTAGTGIRSHYQFQVRTFWIGLLYLFGGVLLLHVGIGGLILIWWFAWSLIRNVKGLLALNRNEPVPNPDSWMFGD